MSITSKTKREHHKTTKSGTGEQQRKHVKTEKAPPDPPKPGNITYQTLDKDSKYGSEFNYSWTVGGCFNAQCNQKSIHITTPGWEHKYLVNVSVPEVPNLGSFRIHRRVAPQFKAFFMAAAKKGLADKVLKNDGTFVARTITNHPGTRSNHAFGSAIDINAAENGYGTKGAARGAKGSVHELADFCADFGIYWGGWYSGNKDLMHFEAVKILVGASLRAACEQHGLVYEEVLPQEGGWAEEPPSSDFA